MLSVLQQVYEGHLDQTEIGIFLLTAVEWIGLLYDFARHPTPITTYIQVPIWTTTANSQLFLNSYYYLTLGRT
jgi:hypothetical protein